MVDGCVQDTACAAAVRVGSPAERGLCRDSSCRGSGRAAVCAVLVCVGSPAERQFVP